MSWRKTADFLRKALQISRTFFSNSGTWGNGRSPCPETRRSSRLRLFEGNPTRQGGFEWSWAVGIRNSHDKTFPAGLVAGAKVFCCENPVLAARCRSHAITRGWLCVTCVSEAARCCAARVRRPPGCRYRQARGPPPSRPDAGSERRRRDGEDLPRFPIFEARAPWGGWNGELYVMARTQGRIFNLFTIREIVDENRLTVMQFLLSPSRHLPLLAPIKLPAHGNPEKGVRKQHEWGAGEQVRLFLR